MVPVTQSGPNTLRSRLPPLPISVRKQRRAFAKRPMADGRAQIDAELDAIAAERASTIARLDAKEAAVRAQH